MNILILTQYFPPEVGAPQNRLFELAVRLKAKGDDITILTAMPNYPQMEIHERYKGLNYFYEEMSGLKVHRSSIYVSKNRSIVSRLKNYFSFVRSSFKIGKKKLGNFDYVICESPPLFLGITAVRLARRKKAKLIFNVSDLWPESAEKLGIVKNKFFLWISYKLEAWCYKNASLITGQTQGIVKNISARFSNKRTYWLPNGVDLSFYDTDSITSTWRKDSGFNETDLLFFYAGIIGHAQGLEVILKAAHILQDKKEIKFVLLGSGPEKEKLLKLKDDLKLTNVFFYDAVSKSQMPAIVKAIDATIIPLKRLDIFKGAIPSKIFECLAMKKAVLLGVEGEAKDLFIDEGKCGLAFEPENEQDLAEKIILLYKNKKLLGEFGENGRNYAAKKFNRDIIAGEFRKQIS